MQRIFYAGDSTVTFNKIDTFPQAGLSQGLLLYLRDDVFLRSFAVNGRSTGSFLAEGRLSEIEERLSEGDVFLIQFGHNDEKKEDPCRYCEPYGAYQENLKRMIDAAKKKGALPVLVTPMARRLFDEAGHFLGGSHGDYPEAMRELANREMVPCIDLNAKSERFLEQVGDYGSRRWFVYPKDNSHLTHEGAAVMAGFLAEGLRDLGEPYVSLFCSVDAQEAQALGKNLGAKEKAEMAASVEAAFQDEKSE